MALTGNPTAVRQFVLDALKLAGAAFSAPDDELVLATCQVTKPGGIFTGPRVVQEQLQLVFTAEGAGRHPSAELVCPGSYRLRWFIAGLRARGFLTRQYYADDLSSRRIEREILALLPPAARRLSFGNQRRSFVPFLMAILRVTAEADEKRDELLPLALSLIDGSARPELPERLRSLSFLPELRYQRVERRRLTWRETWRSLQAKAVEHAASYGTDWYQPARTRLAKEGEQLRQYYQEMMADAEDREAVRTEYLRRMEELREKCTPVIRVNLANLALLYLPVIVYPVQGADGLPLPPIRYEPAAGRVTWEEPERQR